MAHLTKSVEIQAPVSKVYEFMTEPTNLPEIWPSMVEITDIKRPPDGTLSYHWKYKMAGMMFEGDSQTEEVIPEQRVVVTNVSGIPSRFVWTYQPKNGGTQLTVDIEYTIPVPVLGRLAEAAIVKMNDREADALLANLKTIMEG